MPRLRSLDHLTATVARHRIASAVGRVRGLARGGMTVTGLSGVANLGDIVDLPGLGDGVGEVVSIAESEVTVMLDPGVGGVGIGAPVRHLGPRRLFPDDSWLGRVIDPSGAPLDHMPLLEGPIPRPMTTPPPDARQRRGFGPRLSTGHDLFNTILPIARGQRLGLFAGSGVGKSTLLGSFATDLEADVIVIALVGERGREVNQFVDRVLGKRGMERTIVVASTSDRPAIERRQAALAAMTVAEHFRDLGSHVLLMIDSVSRLADAHREIASTAGEPPTLRGFPPSLIPLLAGLCERSGTGGEGQGDITAIMSVLVAASDMDEPVADSLRGLLDGHIVLTRDIAERGRFPAVDVLQSVSRSLPDAASEAENLLIARLREAAALFDSNAMMVRSGLYSSGANAPLDKAIALQPALEEFFSRRTGDGIEASFARLAELFDA